MKLISWNVNGIRACMTKGFMDFFNAIDADIFCIQESKLQEGQIDLDLPGYESYWCYAENPNWNNDFTNEIVGEEYMEELLDYFKSSKKNNLDTALKEFGDVYKPEELRLAYIVFLAENIQ